MSKQPPWDITKPPLTAFIREDECIGCTKCIPDCPTDAIMGAAKLMHTVITDVCTGCELCVPTCPVDCIEMRPIERSDTESKELDALWQSRFSAHNLRIERQTHERQTKHDQARLANELDSVEARKRYIEEALARTRGKK